MFCCEFCFYKIWIVFVFFMIENFCFLIPSSVELLLFSDTTFFSPFCLWIWEPFLVKKKQSVLQMSIFLCHMPKSVVFGLWETLQKFFRRLRFGCLLFWFPWCLQTVAVDCFSPRISPFVFHFILILLNY